MTGAMIGVIVGSSVCCCLLACSIFAVCCLGYGWSSTRKKEEPAFTALDTMPVGTMQPAYATTGMQPSYATKGMQPSYY
jgi:hypothetical protein